MELSGYTSTSALYIAALEMSSLFCKKRIFVIGTGFAPACRPANGVPFKPNLSVPEYPGEAYPFLFSCPVFCVDPFRLVAVYDPMEHLANQV